MESLWNPYGIPMESLWNPYGIPMESLWNPYGIHMESLWNPYGIPMQSLWNPLQLSIVYCLLFIVYCLLSVVCCLLFIVYCLLFIVHCLLSMHEGPAHALVFCGDGSACKHIKNPLIWVLCSSSGTGWLRQRYGRCDLGYLCTLRSSSDVWRL